MYTYIYMYILLINNVIINVKKKFSLILSPLDCVVY